MAFGEELRPVGAGSNLGGGSPTKVTTSPVKGEEIDAGQIAESGYSSSGSDKLPISISNRSLYTHPDRTIGKQLEQGCAYNQTSSRCLFNKLGGGSKIGNSAGFRQLSPQSTLDAVRVAVAQFVAIFILPGRRKSFTVL
jgi:hypothetical protein